MAAANAIGPLEYADPHAARELLTALATDPLVLYAELRDAAGHPLARYAASDSVITAAGTRATPNELDEALQGAQGSAASGVRWQCQRLGEVPRQ